MLCPCVVASGTGNVSLVEGRKDLVKYQIILGVNNIIENFWIDLQRTVNAKRLKNLIELGAYGRMRKNGQKSPERELKDS